MKDAPLLNLCLSLVIVIAIGWLLLIGRPILLPIVTAVISVYIMVSMVEFLARQPVLRHFPVFLLRALVLAGFIVSFIGLAVVLAGMVQEIIAVAPQYEANLLPPLEALATQFGFETETLWNDLLDATIQRVDLQSLAVTTLGGFASVGFTVFLVVIYAGFLLAERGVFAQKISAAFTDEGRAEKALRLVGDINSQIRQYLAVKTLINIILGIVTYIILITIGVDFALFWAVSIALLNYIPYVGSYVGVAFPVILSLGQFAYLPTTLLLLVLLTSAQVFVGNVLEPRWIGRQLNMSPFIVLVALSVWSALWGIPGAILAVPMTSIIIIITSSFDQTRFVAVFLSERVDPPKPATEQEGQR